MGHSAAMTASIRACMSARFAWAHEDDGKCHFMTHRAVVGTPNAERLFSHVLGLNQVGHSPLSYPVTEDYPPIQPRQNCSQVREGAVDSNDGR
jgi:hypothetical protein